MLKFFIRSFMYLQFLSTCITRRPNRPLSAIWKSLIVWEYGIQYKSRNWQYVWNMFVVLCFRCVCVCVCVGGWWVGGGFHMRMFILFRKHLVAYVHTNYFIDIFIRWTVISKITNFGLRTDHHQTDTSFRTYEKTCFLNLKETSHPVNIIIKKVIKTM